MELITKNKEILIIDVRPATFSKWPNFLVGSRNLPLLNITDRNAELPKDQPIILTDWTMRQSPLAAKYLLAHGFNILGVMKGGLVRWEAEGYPVETREVKTQSQ